MPAVRWPHAFAFPIGRKYIPDWTILYSRLDGRMFLVGRVCHNGPSPNAELAGHLEQWPNAMRLGRQTVSLPLSPKLTDADTARVIDAVRDLVR